MGNKILACERCGYAFKDSRSFAAHSLRVLGFVPAELGFDQKPKDKKKTYWKVEWNPSTGEAGTAELITTGEVYGCRNLEEGGFTKTGQIYDLDSLYYNNT